MKKLCLGAALVIMTFGPLTSYSAPSAPYAMTEQEQAVMEVEAFKEYQKKSLFSEKKMGQRIQKTLNNQVKFASHLLMRRGIMYGKTSLAEWEKNHFSSFLTAEIGIDDIGDHQALAWLKTFYDNLESLLGKTILEKNHLDDIKWLAYAIPVVFNPKVYSKLDYQQHFVPMGKACGYWGCLGACVAYKYIGTPLSTFVCDPIATACRIAFGALSEPLSDGIWNSIHK